MILHSYGKRLIDARREDPTDDLLTSLIEAEVDVIVNAAAESHFEKSIEAGASEFVTTNVEGTQILLDAIRETNDISDETEEKLKAEIEKFKNAFSVEEEKGLVGA